MTIHGLKKKIPCVYFILFDFFSRSECLLEKKYIPINLIIITTLEETDIIECE